MLKVDYEKEVMKKRRENIKEVVKNISSGPMQEKIRNYGRRHDLNKSYIEQKIVDDPSFALQFAKDPLKQSIHERTAAKYIEGLEVVSEFKSLPVGGKSAKYVGPTGISAGKNYGSGKSIDFEMKVGDKKVYATHKYTGSEGGAQDNQYNDVKQFIIEVVNMKQTGVVPDNYRFVAILDGPYYERYLRIKELRSLAVGCVEILNINKLEEYLFEIL